MILAFLAKSSRIWLLLGLVLIAINALPPVEAQNLEVERMCDNRLSISWSGPGGYQFFPIGEGGGDVRCSEDEPNCVISGLNPGQDYGYYVDRVTSRGLEYGGEVNFRGAKTGSCPEWIAVTPTPPPPVDTCSHLPDDIVVRGFSPFSTQCQQVSNAGVGNPELIAQGILHAVDVWGNVNDEIQVCFRNQGRLKFLDAATAPRAVSDLVAEHIAGMICGQIRRAGTVVLLQGGQAAMATAAETRDSPPSLTQTGPSSTTSCQVETTARLSLRAGPSVYYARLLSMPRGARLVARARNGDWFMANYDGQLGWAYGGHLAISPGCDALGETRDSPPSLTQTGPSSTTSCQVETTARLSLRAGPSVYYARLLSMPRGTRLVARAQNGDWFMANYDGQLGWANRGHLAVSPGCDALGETDVIILPPMLETPTLEAEAAQTDTNETMSETDSTEILESVGQALTGCSLRTVAMVNLRQGPGLDYDVIVEIPYQTNLNATGRSGDWFVVEHEGMAGWVNNTYVFRTGACG